MWTIYFQCKGKPEDDEFVDTDVDRAHIPFHNLVYFKEQFGYGAWNFLYYKKRGYMAKYSTRSALLKHKEEDAAHSEVLARQERMQHQQEVEELKEKLANEVSARERDKEESMKQIEEIREEFRSTLQQQIQLALQQVLTLEHGSPFFAPLF